MVVFSFSILDGPPASGKTIFLLSMEKELEKKMNVSIFATTNDIDSLSKPLRSRFLEFSLPEYTFEEFDRLSVRLLAQKI
jgi:tRNA uridine 5-carbamoylmethylation protein Kti12